MNLPLPLSVVVLTLNEEANIQPCLSSVAGWANEIFVVDSHSTDRTIEIARQYTDKIYLHTFEGYSQQRNWALRNLSYANEWVFFLDADERPTEELKQEIEAALASAPDDIAGFYIKRRFFFMGRWIKHGYYPSWVLRLFRHRIAQCDNLAVNEHFFVEGKTARLAFDILHEDQRGLSRWIERHNQYATLQAMEMRDADKPCPERSRRGGPTRTSAKGIAADSFEHRRRLRQAVAFALPPFARALLYFVYRYLFRLGFLDGKAGLIYHVLQGFWFPFLVDAKLEELKSK